MQNYLDSAVKQFKYYKQLGDKCFDGLNFKELNWQFNEQSNSISITAGHIVGNMLSRWTNIFTEDGEKEWRNRDAEFEPQFSSKKELIETWESAWQLLFDTLNAITPKDYNKPIYIRNQGHTLTEAINRQLCHYAYHIGQIVYITRMLKGDNWQALTIPKGASKAYDKNKFDKPKSKGHFTDDWL